MTAEKIYLKHKGTISDISIYMYIWGICRYSIYINIHIYTFIHINIYTHTHTVVRYIYTHTHTIDTL